MSIAVFFSLMANPLLTVRVPSYIVDFIQELQHKTNRNKTEVVINLFESSPEFKEFQQEHGIPQREPTTDERLDSIERQLQALQDASHPSLDDSLVQLTHSRLKAIIDRADAQEKGYQTKSFTQGLYEIRALADLLEQRLSHQ